MVKRENNRSDHVMRLSKIFYFELEISNSSFYNEKVLPKYCL